MSCLFQPYVDAPPYIGINLTVNGKAILSPNLAFRRQPSANRIVRLARPREKYARPNEVVPIKSDDDTTQVENDQQVKSEDSKSATNKTENDTEEAENNTKENRAHNDENKTAAILRLKEKNLTLNYDEKTESLLSNVRQSRNLVLHTYSNDAPKRWKSHILLNSEKRLDLGKTGLLQAVSMEANVKQAGKIFENRLVKTKKKRKTDNKLKLSRAEHANHVHHMDGKSSHVEKSIGHVDKGIGHEDNVRSAATRVITMQEEGTPRTILRYTDKRYGGTNTIAIDMGPETQLRNNTEVVIN